MTKDDDARLAELIEVVIAIASNDFSKRANVGDGRNVLDGLAAGLNMLAEEVGQRHAREKEFQQRLLQNERLLAVGQLAAGVAHEINNPAAFVLANLGALQRNLGALEGTLLSMPPDERAEAKALVVESQDITRDNREGLERIVTIVRNLRNFSRVEPEQFERLTVGEIIEEGCRLVRAEISYRAQLVIEPFPAELRVRGDRTRLAQVLTNLLVNAAHAIPEQGRPQQHQVALSAARSDDAVVIRVRDTGVGIAPDVQARLFEPFFTTKPRGQGSGLGLALSADIVHSHGGTLRLVETSPRGSTFEVRLPLEHTPTPVPRPRPGAVVPRARIMIIDDERMLLTAYRRAFSPHYELTLIDTAREAMQALERDDRYDAIICDVMMPELDGVDFDEWAQARGGLRDRVLFSTGGAFSPRTVSFVERHEARVLPKPLSIESIAAAIAQLKSR